MAEVRFLKGVGLGWLGGDGCLGVLCWGPGVVVGVEIERVGI